MLISTTTTVPDGLVTSPIWTGDPSRGGGAGRLGPLGSGRRRIHSPKRSSPIGLSWRHACFEQTTLRSQSRKTVVLETRRPWDGPWLAGLLAAPSSVPTATVCH